MSIQKPADDLELLLYVAADPVRLLGGKSLPLFDSFKFGYICGLPAGSTFSDSFPAGFEDLVRERFSAPERWPNHLSADSYIRLLGSDEASAFDLYVALRQDCFAASPLEGSAPRVSEGSRLDEGLEAVCRCPRMYFGNSPDLMSCLVALLNGAIEAERVLAGVSPTAVLLDGFQCWLNVRHPWALGRPWHRIISSQNLWDSERSMSGFWTHFNLFRSGASPDALTPVGKREFEANPGLDDLSAGAAILAATPEPNILFGVIQ